METLTKAGQKIAACDSVGFTGEGLCGKEVYRLT
jgi:hypothetical protein